ncbi:hypothetical protein GCM10010218_25950 [Streptomyces mashuensis]|uniref:Uncharacterized protein n=1 Tax=Streptomyces mashuensis TaxID=33904 RepID=A0A919B222_9ACTN|nr:hypothetical protein GCM10010218_25950 [Streptomyces mashuensis]
MSTTRAGSCARCAELVVPAKWTALTWVFMPRSRCDDLCGTVAISHTGVNLAEVIHRSSEFFPTVDEGVDNSSESSGQSLRGPLFPLLFRRYFHCVETTNPAAMKPKPTTMFQLCSDSTGMSPLVT